MLYWLGACSTAMTSPERFGTNPFHMRSRMSTSTSHARTSFSFAFVSSPDGLKSR